MDPEDRQDEYDDAPDAFADAFASAAKGPDPEDELEDVNPPSSDATASDDSHADTGHPPSDEDGGEVDEAWANAPEELRAKYEEIMRERDELAHKARSDAGRVYALQNRLVELQKLADSAPAEGGARKDFPTAEVIAKAMQTEEEWQGFSKEYPEIAKAMGGAMTRAIDAAVSGALKHIEQTQQPVIDYLKHDVDTRHRREAINAVEEDHAGWQDVVRSDNFKNWLDQQPANVVSLIYSEDAAETAALLDYFAAGTGYNWNPSPSGGEDGQQTSVSRLRSDRQRRLQNAQGVPRRGSSPRPADQSDFDGAFRAAVAAAKRQAQRS